jgi:preprotein translocase subunit SecG
VTDLIVSGIVYALTLVALILLSRGTQRRLLSIGYGFLTLFAFRTTSVLLASLVAIGLALWLRGPE